MRKYSILIILMVFSLKLAAQVSFSLASSPGVGSGAQALAAVDVNSDGYIDLMTANGFDNSVSVMMNNGLGGFTLASSPGTGSDPSSIFSTDLNGDGLPDLITGNYND